MVGSFSNTNIQLPNFTCSTNYRMNDRINKSISLWTANSKYSFS